MMLSQTTRILQSYVEGGWQNSTRSGNRMGESVATATCFVQCILSERGDITVDNYVNCSCLSAVQ
jgi:hypothetical protein